MTLCMCSDRKREPEQVATEVVATARIAACTDYSIVFAGGTHRYSNVTLGSLGHATLSPKRQLDWFSRFCRDHGRESRDQRTPTTL